MVGARSNGPNVLGDAGLLRRSAALSPRGGDLGAAAL
eukprot:CAMPEP_0198525028 /NCGR_PEP_ID=MMETSP1462-20131121/23100_1 /TAXON_ID=1333877 /ORGANISM="Brandtodinium nutriculum, Strain RCC3387" /LENGTH=36 /DNA_ID= /DNA_START= /DNA_END= /DNA_ORIENTATION=